MLAPTWSTVWRGGTNEHREQCGVGGAGRSGRLARVHEDVDVQQDVAARGYLPRPLGEAT